MALGRYSTRSDADMMMTSIATRRSPAATCPEIGPSRAHNGVGCESAIMCLRHHLLLGRFGTRAGSVLGGIPYYIAHTQLHSDRQMIDGKFSTHQRLLMDNRGEQEVGH